MDTPASRLGAVLAAMPDVAIAVSGGVDSLTLATFAHRLGSVRATMFHATSAAVPPEEIRAAVRAAIAGGATELGPLMAKVMPQFKGRADGKIINAIVREELAG